MKIRFGLQARFLALVVAGVLIAALALGALLQRQWTMRQEILALTQDSIQSLVVSRLQEQARSVGANTAHALVNPLYTFDLEMIGRIVGDVLAQPDVRYVTVFAPNGAVIHDGTDSIASYGQVMSDPLGPTISEARELAVHRIGDVLDVSAPILLGDERLGGVRIGYTLDSVQRHATEATALLSGRLDEVSRRYLFGSLGLLGLAIALGVCISLIMQRILIRPIRRLAVAAREIEAGNLSLALPGHGNRDEIGELVQSFERMTEGLARRDRDIRRIANTDSLTGIANRRAFRENLEASVATGADSEFALVLADMDDFKPFNDSLGHDVGDKILVRFAERLRQVVNADDRIEAKPARLGGDEFTLLARAAPEAQAPLRELLKELAEHLVEEFKTEAMIDGRSILFSASYGIAVFPHDGRSPAQLMKAADIAMYAAKRAGKHRYRFYQPTMALRSAAEESDPARR